MRFELPGNGAISASAGTGKTFNLAARYVRLLACGVDPCRIVALTFSRKAAGEIFDRIVTLMLEWIDDPATMRKHCASLGMAPIESVRLTEMLTTVLRSLHLLQIGTIDSFFVRIVRTFPFEFGLAASPEILDEMAIDSIRTSVARQVLWETAAREDREEFLYEFKQATFGVEEKRLFSHFMRFITTNHATFLATAGAGMWGDPQAIWPQGNPLLEFQTDPALEAAALRPVVELYGIERDRNRFLEFLRQAETYGPASHLSDKYATVNDLFRDNLLGALLDLEQGVSNIKNYNRKTRLDFDPQQCQALARLVRHLVKCHFLNTLEKSEGMYRILNRYEDVYDRQVRRKGKMTFGDIQYVLSPLRNGVGRQVLSGRSDAAAGRLYIDYRLDSRYDHWLLDEFQDTSFEQWGILSTLIDEVMQSPGERTFFYVGDIKQAIYGWRAGDARLFSTIAAGFEQQYGNFPVTTLETSYRSGPQVVATVNKVFTGLPNRLSGLVSPELAGLWEWKEHVSARPERQGYTSLIELGKDDLGRGGAAERHLDRCGQIIGQTISQIGPFERNLSVAVLVRKNETGRYLAECLRQQNIPAVLEGKIKITDNDVVRAILSLVKFAFHPADTFSREHLAMTPFGPLLDDAGHTSQRVLDCIFHQGYAALVESWTRWLDVTAGIALTPFSRQRISQLLTASRQFDAGGSKSGREYIAYIQAYEQAAPSGGNAVQVMTVHKSKGLEWDVVFLPELKGRFGIAQSEISGIKVFRKPDRSPGWAVQLPPREVALQDHTIRQFLADQDQEQFYDALCVLYVAMTRAARALYLIIEERGKTAEAVHAADIVRATLAEGDQPEPCADFPGIPARRWFQLGDPQWFAACPAARRPAGTAEPIRKLRVVFDKILRQTAPSHGAHQSTDLSRLFSGSESAALSLGVAVHALYAELEDAAGQNPPQLADGWRLASPFRGALVDEACRLFLASLESPAVIHALSRPSGASEIWRERAFTAIVEGELVNGVFDRVTVLRDDTNRVTAATILDYKTDAAFTDEEIAAATAAYRPQLELYRKALVVLLGLTSADIRMQLLFVRAKKIIELN